MLLTDRIYLDHAATSPLRPEARAAMEEGFALWANPSSPHAEGRKAKNALEDARARIKAACKWDGEVIFTSGATEAINLAIRGSGTGGTVSVSAIALVCVFSCVDFLVAHATKLGTCFISSQRAR